MKTIFPRHDLNKCLLLTCNLEALAIWSPILHHYLLVSNLASPVGCVFSASLSLLFSSLWFWKFTLLSRECYLYPVDLQNKYLARVFQKIHISFEAIYMYKYIFLNKMAVDGYCSRGINTICPCSRGNQLKIQKS